MRDFKGMKRQRSRNRSGGGGGGGGGGGKPQHNTNRAFDSNGPEGVKVRGAAQHVYEKYPQLARDAQTDGDRVLAENYLQHAEHYFRLMRAMQPLRPLSEIIGRDQFVSGYDIDFEDESGGEGGEGEQETEAQPMEAESGGDRQPRFEGRRDDYRPNDPRARDDQPRADRYQSDRQQSDRQQSDRPQADRYQSDRQQTERVRDDRPRDERPREERPRDERAPRQNREDRPRFNRDDRPVRAERPERAERDPLGVIEPEATPLTATNGLPNDGPVLRADDGEFSHAPAFLQVRPSEARAEGAEEPRRPRRRRAPATFTADEAPVVDEG